MFGDFTLSPSPPSPPPPLYAPKKLFYTDIA